MTIAATDETQGECLRCGYDLRGIANDQPCPECGLLAERSRRITDELHDTRPRWLRRLAWGVWLILLAIPLCAISPIEVGIAESFGQPPNFLVRFFWEQLPFFAIETPALVFFAGVWLLTSAEGYAPADQADQKFRRLLRCAALVPMLALILMHVQSFLSQNYGLVRYRTWRFAPTALLTIGCVPLPPLLFWQLRNLAKRARSAHLAEHCAIVGVGASLSLLYLAVVWPLIETDSLGVHWVGQSELPLILVLVMAVAAGLFILWSIYLLIRFALAFSRARRQLRRKWMRDDRSAAIA